MYRLCKCSTRSSAAHSLTVWGKNLQQTIKSWGFKFKERKKKKKKTSTGWLSKRWITHALYRPTRKLGLRDKRSRAPVLCQSMFPRWYVSTLTTGIWDGSVGDKTFAKLLTQPGVLLGYNVRSNCRYVRGRHFHQTQQICHILCSLANLHIRRWRRRRWWYYSKQGHSSGHISGHFHSFLWHQKQHFLHLYSRSPADISSPFCGDPTWLLFTGNGPSPSVIVATKTVFLGTCLRSPNANQVFVCA